MTEKGIRLSSRKCEPGILGLHSDTYGFLIGGVTDRKEIHIAVGGFVLACTDREYAPGTPLTAGPSGKLTKMSLMERIIYPERMVGVFHQKEQSYTWNGIPVNGRHWIKVR